MLQRFSTSLWHVVPFDLFLKSVLNVLNTGYWILQNKNETRMDLFLQLKDNMKSIITPWLFFYPRTFCWSSIVIRRFEWRNIHPSTILPTACPVYNRVAGHCAKVKCSIQKWFKIKYLKPNSWCDTSFSKENYSCFQTGFLYTPLPSIGQTIR